MLFHHHGYVSGDPRIQPVAGSGVDRPRDLPDELDVLIIGAGPAGMLTAAQLSQFPEVHARLVDRRPGRLVIGQADGIQARSVETFQAFGFANRIMDEAYRITETCFWRPDPDNPSDIVRSARTPDDPAQISEFPHLIVNQARVLDHYAEVMAQSPTRMTPDWGYELVSLEVAQTGDHPVTVRLRRVTDDAAGQEVVVRARYVLGADGARSRVREAIGARYTATRANHAWGVMDVLANTDFPDIRTKSIIQGRAGSILHIPREGGYLFRMYVDLGDQDAENPGAVRQTPIEEIIRRAGAIIHPYSLDVREVCWWSVYEVGHRVTERFDDVPADQVGTRQPRVFIAGDACHTHSAKAGQGMNVSMQDGFNLGWKLGQVLRGLSPAELLGTYTAERQVIAQNLIDFDLEWSSRMATVPTGDDDLIEDFYVQTAEFPAGFMTQYPPSLIVGAADHQHLAGGFPLGKRFKSAPVVRVCDANPVQLGHLHRADGRWRIYAFADRAPAGTESPLTRWADWLTTSPESPVVAHTPAGRDVDALFDVKVIYQQPYTEVETTDAPDAFRPASGPYGLVNANLVFAADPEDDIFDARGLDRDGVVVVVRPDQYVAHVLPLTATDELSAVFRPIFTT